MAKNGNGGNGKAVATIDEQQKALAAYDYGGEGGQGFEGGSDAFRIPWLRIAQSNTPQVETIEGLKAGYIFNTVTNQYWTGEEGILFVPALFQHKVCEWVPRKDGGGGGQGFAGLHEPNEPLYVNALKALGPEGKFKRGEDGKIVRPKNPGNGNELVDTRYAWGHHVVEGTTELVPAGISFASTHISAFFDWNTSAKLQTYVASDGVRRVKPLFAHCYRITTKKVERNGNKWYVPVVSWAKGDALRSLVDPNSELFTASKALIETIKSGAAKIDYAAQGGNETGAAEGGAGGDDVPF